MHFSSQMPVQCEIFPVLTQSRITAPISSFLRLIEGVHSPLPDFQKALSSCYVTDISQYRCNKTAHEVVIVRMKYSGVDVDAPDTHTTRYYRFDRFREQSRQREPDNGFSKLIEQTVEGSISSLKSYQRHDQVKVSDELINDALGVLSTKYDLVREFGVKQGTMSILEALVIADTISELSQHYTIFVHMCQFWATNLFLVLKVIVGSREHRDVIVSTGPQLAKAGTVANIRLVNMDTGIATVDLFRGTDEGLRNLCNRSSNRMGSIARAQLPLLSCQLMVGGSASRLHDCLWASNSNEFVSKVESSLEAVKRTIQKKLDTNDAAYLARVNARSGTAKDE